MWRDGRGHPPGAVGIALVSRKEVGPEARQGREEKCQRQGREADAPQARRQQVIRDPDPTAGDHGGREDRAAQHA